MFWKKILFIFNPVAGMSRIRDSLLDIISILSSHGYSVECYPTKAPGDARRIVRECKNEYLYICCAGGDGTLDEVVSGMMENRELPFLPIGYIPSGTTNDFAGTLGIPSDMKEAAEVIASGKVFNCDIGRFNQEDYFTYVAGFGLFTETSYDTPQELKNTLGHFAYIIRGAMSLGNIRTYKAIVQAKNINIRDEFAVGLITNSKSVGGFANITGNNVDLSDGLFEVTLIKMPRNPIEINEIFRTAWMIKVIDTVKDNIYTFKKYGPQFVDIITLAYTSSFDSTVEEMAEELQMSTQNFYKKKRYATILFAYEFERFRNALMASAETAGWHGEQMTIDDYMN